MKLNVTVHPNSRNPRIIEQEDGTLLVYLNEPAKDGRANKALIKKLASYYKVSKSQVEIVDGLTSKIKIIQVHH